VPLPARGDKVCESLSICQDEASTVHLRKHPRDYLGLCTSAPTSRPTLQPSMPTLQPSSAPTLQPSSAPTLQPSSAPTLQPSSAPTLQPSSAPTLQPSFSSDVRVVRQLVSFSPRRAAPSPVMS
jgi:hypothetical protein